MNASPKKRAGWSPIGVLRPDQFEDGLAELEEHLQHRRAVRAGLALGGAPSIPRPSSVGDGAVDVGRGEHDVVDLDDRRWGARRPVSTPVG